MCAAALHYFYSTFYYSLRQNIPSNKEIAVYTYIRYAHICITRYSRNPARTRKSQGSFASFRVGAAAPEQQLYLIGKVPMRFPFILYDPYKIKEAKAKTKRGETFCKLREPENYRHLLMKNVWFSPIILHKSVIGCDDDPSPHPMDTCHGN